MSAVPAPPVPSWPLYRAMVGVGLLCGALIVSVYQTTAPRIARNRQAALEAAIYRVLPEATRLERFAERSDGGFAPVAAARPAPRDERIVYAGYDETGRLSGLAIEAAGMGYQDTIRVIYGYSPERRAIIGMQVLESKETPGLGDRIRTDPDFLASFERLDVSLDPEGALRHEIVAVARGRRTHDWEIDGITGATISSQAVARLLRASTASWIPALQRHVADFRPGAVDDREGDRDEPS